VAEKTDAEKVIGLEPSQSSLNKAVRHEKIDYIQIAVKKDTLREVKDILIHYRPKVLLARRVFPEIAEQGVGIVTEFARLCYESELDYIILEGRKPTKKAKNPLNTAELEVQALNEYYKPVGRLNSVFALQRRGME